MKHLHIAIITTVALAAFSASAVDLSKMPPASAKKDLTFEKDIKPLMEASCIKCHGENKPKAGLRLDSLAGVLKGSKEGKVVEPGNALKSPLLISVSRLDPETAMPVKPKNGPSLKPLTAEEVGVVRAWIDQGAK